METATQTLHRLTSYRSFDEATLWDPPVDDPRVVRDFEPNDVDRLPWFYKSYDGALPTLPLPRDLPETTPSTVNVLAGTATVTPRRVDLAHLSRLLHLAAGVVRTSPRRYGELLFRAAGSAGGRFPLEVYVAVPEGGALPPGVHWYHPQDHALVRVAPAPRADAPAVVVTGVPWRTGWRYRERGFRHVYWDAGTLLSQLLAAATSAGIAPYLYSRFPDESVAALVGADRVHEWPVATVALGAPSEPAPGGPAATGAVDAAPREFPLVTAAQRAGDAEVWGRPWSSGETVDVDVRSPSVEHVIRTRGSQRLLDPAGTLPVEMLRRSMAGAMRGIDVPHLIAAHAVDGLTPGLYRWPDLETPRRVGDLRAELYHFCMDQGLGRDASFVVVAVTPAVALDDRSYRDAQLAAGLVEGRLHLLAYAQRAAASGMTFVDGLVATLVEADADGLLVTCVGVPEYQSKPGGLPGAPTAVRGVEPR